MHIYIYIQYVCVFILIYISIYIYIERGEKSFEAGFLVHVHLFAPFDQVLGDRFRRFTGPGRLGRTKGGGPERVEERAWKMVLLRKSYLNYSIFISIFKCMGGNSWVDRFG